MLPNKIMIIGTSGSGKTTLGRRISASLGHPHTDLDDLFWLPGWVRHPDDHVIKNINKIVDADRWVITGNYTSIGSKHIWPEAELIIWLDYSIWRCLWQGIKRSVHHIIRKEPMCNGNYEKWSRLLGSESILLWIITTHRKRKKRYTQLLQPHIGKLHQIKSPAHLERSLHFRNTLSRIET
ncbi:MAG: adenylate kinase [Chlamydiales bacterium]|nr:adenylate kinase [Chlamydiales bacterium]